MTCKLTVIGYTFQTFMLILSQKFNCKFTILTKDSHLTAWKVSDVAKWMFSEAVSPKGRFTENVVTLMITSDIIRNNDEIFSNISYIIL